MKPRHDITNKGRDFAAPPTSDTFFKPPNIPKTEAGAHILLQLRYVPGTAKHAQPYFDRILSCFDRTATSISSRARWSLQAEIHQKPDRASPAYYWHGKS